MESDARSLGFQLFVLSLKPEVCSWASTGLVPVEISRLQSSQCSASTGLMPVEPRLAATRQPLPFPLFRWGEAPNEPKKRGCANRP